MKSLSKFQWRIVQFWLKVIFFQLRLLRPFLDCQRFFEQSVGKFTPGLSLALDLLDNENPQI